MSRRLLAIIIAVLLLIPQEAVALRPVASKAAVSAIGASLNGDNRREAAPEQYHPAHK